MDVVYLVKSTSENDELRHSLRSLKNLNHDRVFFAGYKPTWVRNVLHIPTVQLPGQKHANSIRNQKAALADPRVSDPFVLMNDDHFIMQRHEEMPILNWGRVRTVLDTCDTLGATFRSSMEFTLKLLQSEGYVDPVSYQLHVPLVIRKRELHEVFETFGDRAPVGINTQYVTIAGNKFSCGGVSYTHDVKIHSPERTLRDMPWVKESAFLSTSDVAFQYGHIGSYIRGVFPKKSQYER